MDSIWSMRLAELAFISAVNPWLLAGAIGIAAPIIIHLLSRRKFQVVPWAAMDFLLNAEKRNRRRIRLEHLLLLLLRCLVILLIAMLVARLFFTQSGLAAMLGQTARTERIVLLDDSPSMTLRNGARDVLETSKQALIRFVRDMAAERSGDELTLYLTSDPDQPVINGRLFGEQESLVRTIEQIEPADAAANLDRALLALEDHIADAGQQGSGAINRLIYLVSDMRRRDWQPAGDAPEDRAIPDLLHRLGAASDGVVVVDMQADPAPNLTLRAIEPTTDTLVAGVPVTFEVSVTNHGRIEARDVEVTFTPENGAPRVGYIDVIQPGRTGSALFTTTFPDPGDHPLAAELSPDPLPADNHRDHVARVREGVPVLLVDGDPSSDPYRSETFVLQRAVSPDQGERSGNRVTGVTESQLANQTLSDYQVIMLANVYDLPDAMLEALDRWVRRGGGLVFFLGDQVDGALYNQRFYRGGAGLMPAQLVAVRGDESERTFANVGRILGNHALTRRFDGADDPLVKFSKFFRWWHVNVPEAPGATEALDGSEASGDGASGGAAAQVLMTLNNADRSPLMVEQVRGKGRVITVTTSADGDWTNWPAKEGYVITMLELVRHIARGEEDTWNVRVGQPLIHELAIDTYRRQARLQPPDAAEPTTLQAVPRVAEQGASDGVATAASSGNAATTGVNDQGNGDGPPSDPGGPSAGRPAFILRYADTGTAGIYRAGLERHDGTTDPRLFSAALDPTEGDLTPADRGALRETLGESKVELLTAAEALEAGSAGGRREIWRTVAFVLIGVLCAEQFLAWHFGRRR